MGTPDRETQECCRNIIECEDPGRYIPIIFLLYSWGSLFGVPIKVLLLVSWEGMNGEENGNYYNGLCKDYYKNPFLHS